ncbi:MAG: GreA/GreB family elongation factor [Verrucomicrobiia bacterium]|jgi:transcription elongation GreA/GreB family factor
MREEFEKLVFAGKIKLDQVDILVELTEGSYCMHKSWGFGRITAVDTVLSKFNIDFIDKPGHALDLGFAADTLEPIAAEHILARKMADLESVQKMAAVSHIDLIKLVIRSYGHRATADTVQKALVPDVISSDWKKWWDTCKREMKKSGHFRVPSKKSEYITFTEEEVSLQDRSLSDFAAAKGLKAKTTCVADAIKLIEEMSDRKVLSETISEILNLEIEKYRRNQPWLSLDGIFVRDELRGLAEVEIPEGETCEADLWTQTTTLPSIIDKLPAAKHKRTLRSYKDAHPDAWADAVVLLANAATPKLCGECVNLLVSNGHFGLFKERLARLISQHQASSEMLLWLAKDRSDTFADIIGPEVFRAMLTAIERDLFNEKKSVKLADYILADQELLPQLIESADLEVVKDVTRALQMSNGFDDMDKRSLLARIVKTFPQIQSLISGDTSKEDATLTVSWESLERRKNEYQELITKKIPDNRKEIAIARSYGDLRENSEYKFAKEQQATLMTHKSELERDINLARGTDFSDAQSKTIAVGTRITVTDLASKESLNFEILGAWDGDPDHGRLSYLSPLAQALSNHKVGEEAELEMNNAKRSYRVDSIAAVEPWKMPEVPVNAPEADAAEEAAATEVETA